MTTTAGRRRRKPATADVAAPSPGAARAAPCSASLAWVVGILLRRAGAVDAAHLVPQRDRRGHQPAVALRAADARGLRELLRRVRPARARGRR